MLPQLAVLLSGMGAKRAYDEGERRRADEDEDRFYMRTKRSREDADYQRADQLRKDLGEAYMTRTPQSAEVYQPAVDDGGEAMLPNPTAGTFKVDDQFGPTGARQGVYATMGAAQTAADAANQPRAQMSRVADVYGRAGMADKAMGVRSMQRQDEAGELQLKQAQDAEKRTTGMREISSMLLKGGASAIPDIYARYNDGFGAKVEVGEGGKFTVVQTKGEKEVGRQAYDSLEEFYTEAAGQFDPNLWLAARKERRKEDRERRKDESEAGYKARMATVAEKNAETNEQYRQDTARAAQTRADNSGKPKASTFERMDESDKVQYQGLAEQVKEINKKEIELAALGKDAPEGAAAALKQRRASVEMRMQSIMGRYQQEGGGAADPFGVRGGGVAPSVPAGGEQAGRDREAGLLMIRSEFGGDVGQAAAGVQRLLALAKQHGGEAGSIYRSEAARLQAGIDAMGTKSAAAPPAPKPTPMATMAAPAPATPVDQAGAALDAARQQTKTAAATLQSYGQRQRAQDPQGFANAQAALASAQQAEQQALAAYQRIVPQTAATFGRYPSP